MINLANLTTSRLQNVARASYLTLILFIPIWLYFYPVKSGWIFPIMVWWLPLLFPLPGVLSKNTYTMTWANFILLIPFSHAIMVWLSNPEEARWAMTELLLILLYFTFYTLSVKRLKTQ